jgi:hypothetical protein
MKGQGPVDLGFAIIVFVLEKVSKFRFLDLLDATIERLE